MVNRPDVLRYLEAGTRAVDLRQKVIANNLAHVDVPDYRRSEVAFESLLADALDQHHRLDLEEVAPQVHQPGSTPVKPNGNDVDLEQEIGALIKNSGRYKAYARLLNKTFRQMHLAISGRL